MAQIQTGQWPDYTYIVPQTYTKARIRLIGLGRYVPAGMITNEFFAYVASRLGDPRRAEDLERVTGLSTRHVRASTLGLCRKIAGKDAPGLIDSPEAPRDESVVDMAVIAAQRALASAGRDASEIDTVIGASSSDNYILPTVANLVQLRLGLRPVRDYGWPPSTMGKLVDNFRSYGNGVGRDLVGHWNVVLTALETLGIAAFAVLGMGTQPGALGSGARFCDVLGGSFCLQ